jgi:hypothetical protein
VKTYRDRGYDIYDTDGKLDADKIDAIHAEQQIKGKEGTSRSETAQHWDERYRRARAQRAERALAIEEAELVRKADVVGEWRARVIGLRTLLVGLGREVAPRLVGKNVREVQALIDVRCFEILRTFAHQKYLPEVEK